MTLKYNTTVVKYIYRCARRVVTDQYCSLFAVYNFALKFTRFKLHENESFVRLETLNGNNYVNYYLLGCDVV
jgi:hypothetical protein